MFGRIAARLLIQALGSKAVQTAGIEVTRYVARRATAFLLRKLRSGKVFND